MSDTTLRKAAGLAVLVVAAIAATVSYLHIYHLAVLLGQPALAAYLMPLSVDGAVAAASAAMLSAARAGVSSPGVARLMLASGVIATLAANAYSGAGHGVAGIILAMWPGLAFIGSTETALSMTRRSARVSSSTAAAVEIPVPVESLTAVTRPGIGQAWPRLQAVSTTATTAATDRRVQRTAKPAKTVKRPAKVADKAAVIVGRQPDISGAELGRRLRVSERTGRRLLAGMSAA